MKKLLVTGLIMLALATWGCSEIDSYRYGDEIRSEVLEHYKMSDAAYTLNEKLGVFTDPKFEWPVPAINSRDDYEVNIEKITDSKSYIYDKIAIVEIKNILNGMSWNKKVGYSNGRWEVTLDQTKEDLDRSQQKTSSLQSIYGL